MQTTMQKKPRRSPPRLALVVGAMLLVATGCGGGDLSEDTVQIDELSEVGDCLGPDPQGTDRFVPQPCEDPTATVEILAMDTPRCPSRSARQAPTC